MSPPSPAETSSRDCERFLVACVAEPKGGTKPLLGVIVVGMGMADIVATRYFAHQGWVGMQIRLIRDTALHNDLQRRFGIYDQSGVSRCREAMDFLARNYGVQKFILMGNCTLANICFNAGVADPRVVGLILTNPHVSNPLTDRFSFRLRRHLFEWRSWRRLFTGGMRLRAHAESANAIKWTFKDDVVLPDDFDRQLKRLLTVRPVRALVVIAEGEPGFSYFQRHYRRTLDALSAGRQLRFEVLRTHTHDFSANDGSIRELNELIADWITKSWACETSPHTAAPARRHQNGGAVACGAESFSSAPPP